MDEIHANLQHGGNKICPCAIVHEGYEEVFVKRKKLKNIRYFASSKLTYEELWEVIFDYVDKKYDIDKFKKIFVSGDGASLTLPRAGRISRPILRFGYDPDRGGDDCHEPRAWTGAFL